MITWRIDQGAEAKLQEHLAGEVLRFHVLANSDSEEDQTLKLKVRDAVLDTMEAALPKGLDVEATKRMGKDAHGWDPGVGRAYDPGKRI